jgi:hypothetical protein
VRDLDDDDFEVRERVTTELGRRVEDAAAVLEQALAASPSAEARARIERILAGRGSAEARAARAEESVRVLECADSPEARACLGELAKGRDERLKKLAQDALERLKASAAK